VNINIRFVDIIHWFIILWDSGKRENYNLIEKLEKKRS